MDYSQFDAKRLNYALAALQNAWNNLVEVQGGIRKDRCITVNNVQDMVYALREVLGEHVRLCT